MKAKVPTPNDVMGNLVRDSVYRWQLITMLVLKRKFGFGRKRMTDFVLECGKEARRYELNDAGGVGNELLFQDAESEGLPINEEIKAQILRDELNKWRAGIK